MALGEVADQWRQGLHRAQIGDPTMHLAAVGADVGDHLLHRRFVDIHRDHRRAFQRVALRNGAANATPCTGDQCNLPPQPCHPHPRRGSPSRALRLSWWQAVSESKPALGQLRFPDDHSPFPVPTLEGDHP